MTQRLIEVTDAAVSLEAQLSNGRTGATALVAIRDASTLNSWLDFSDNTFKIIGWVTRQAAMAEVSAANAPGLYRLAVSIPAMIPARVAGGRLIAEFVATAAGPPLLVHGIEYLTLVTELNDIAAEASVGALPTAAAIADQVWDEARAGHVAVGSFGEALDARVSLVETEAAALARAAADIAEHDATQVDIANLNDPSAGDIDTQLSGTHGAGSWLTGAGGTPAAVADAVWDELRAGHVGAGSFGEALDAQVSLTETEAAASARAATSQGEHDQTQADIAALNDLDAATAADAVWDEARAAHVAVGSFGEALDATITSRESEASASARATTNQTEHDQTQTDIAALNDLDAIDVAAAVVVGLTAQGYTAARALLLDNLDAAISSRSAPGDLMGLVAGAITSAKIAADAFTAAQFDASMQSYQAKVWNFDDDLAGTPADRYGVAYFKNGNFITAGIVSPTLRVVKNVDGTDLVATVPLVAVAGFPGLFRYDETSGPARMVDGQGYFAIATATLDGSPRSWPQQIGRDNTP